MEKLCTYVLMPYIPSNLPFVFIDLKDDGHHGGHGEDLSKHFIDGIPLATSCNDKPCEFEDEFPWNSVRLPSFIKPIRYDVELTPNLTTLTVKGNFFLVFSI